MNSSGPGRSPNPMQFGFRTMMGLLTILVLVYFGLFVQGQGKQTVATLVYVLAGLRLLLLVYDVVRRRRLARAAQLPEPDARFEAARRRRGAGPEVDDAGEGDEGNPTGDEPPTSTEDPPAR